MTALGARHTIQERLPVDGRTLLLVIATVALVALDLAHLTVATAVGAAALAVFVVGSLTRRQAARFGIYGFLIAEISPVSLQADVATAFIYQAFCVLLLTAVIAPFPQLLRLSAYGRPVLMTLAVTVASLVPGIVLFYTKWLGLTALQAASLSGAILLVVVGTVLYVRRDMIPLQAVRGV
jgi:hypothetical protein